MPNDILVLDPRALGHQLGGMAVQTRRGVELITKDSELKTLLGSKGRKLGAKKLLGTSASLLVTSALLVVTRSY